MFHMTVKTHTMNAHMNLLKHVHKQFQLCPQVCISIYMYNYAPRYYLFLSKGNIFLFLLSFSLSESKQLLKGIV